MLKMPFGYCYTHTHTNTLSHSHSLCTHACMHILLLLPWKLCPLCSSSSLATQMSHLGLYVKSNIWNYNQAGFQAIVNIKMVSVPLSPVWIYIFWEITDAKTIFIIKHMSNILYIHIYTMQVLIAWSLLNENNMIMDWWRWMLLWT